MPIRVLWGSELGYNVYKASYLEPLCLYLPFDIFVQVRATQPALPCRTLPRSLPLPLPLPLYPSSNKLHTHISIPKTETETETAHQFSFLPPLPK